MAEMQIHHQDYQHQIDSALLSEAEGQNQPKSSFGPPSCLAATQHYVWATATGVPRSLSSREPRAESAGLVGLPRRFLLTCPKTFLTNCTRHQNTNSEFMRKTRRGGWGQAQEAPRRWHTREKSTRPGCLLYM